MLLLQSLDFSLFVLQHSQKNVFLCLDLHAPLALSVLGNSVPQMLAFAGAGGFVRLYIITSSLALLVAPLAGEREQWSAVCLHYKKRYWTDMLVSPKCKGSHMLVENPDSRPKINHNYGAALESSSKRAFSCASKRGHVDETEQSAESDSSSPLDL
jgi:hypothetical protein